MSVYGGFATRTQETRYNTVLFKLLHAVQSKLKLSLQIINSFN